MKVKNTVSQNIRIFAKINKKKGFAKQKSASTLKYVDCQCWGKLLLKVMHYNIALLPKKVTNYIT